MLIVDAHQDLAWNMLTFGRDYTRAAHDTRRLETGTLAAQKNDDTLLGWPDYQRGRVALVFATLFAAPLRACEGSWDTLCYADDEQASQLYRRQLDAYARLFDDHPTHFRPVRARPDLAHLLQQWEAVEKAAETAEPGSSASEKQAPVGLVLLMEGAEAVRDPGELEWWWQQGVRLIGPAWRGNRYCGGTREPGPLTKAGFALLESMAAFGFGLDLSHMDGQAARQALDFYPGPIVASHSNLQAVVRDPNTNRHLSEAVLTGLLERDGVIGIVPFNAFLKAGWRRGDPPQQLSLQHVIAQIDYVCQAAGDARHVGLGTDFDGGFGLQAAPPEIDTIADLQKLRPLLQEKGYTQEEIAAILGQNWLRKLEELLPADG